VGVPRDDEVPVVDDDTRESARTLAAEGAARVGVEIADLHRLSDLRAASRLLDAVWGRDDSAGAIMPTEALTALAHAGGQVTGAFAGTTLVGVTAAFVGAFPSGALRLHSHVTGVAPEASGRGVGRALKLHQRAWCLERDIIHVRWTFDPLVRRNAVFNLVALGARAIRFERDVYGPMADARNAGLPTDRLVADWDLAGPRTGAALSGRAAAPDVAALRRSGATPTLTVGTDDEPVRSPADAPRRLVQVPADIEAIRARDADLARAWADAVRGELGAAMEVGARVTGISRDGWYVLATPTGTQELLG
jgi:predicted GNAT superfamily acetyltransferase